MKLTKKRLFIGAAIVVFVIFVFALALPNFIGCHCTDKADTIVNCLGELDGAKIQWAIDHKGISETNLTWRDLSPYFAGDFWHRPVAGETYHINKIGEPASALVPNKTDWIPANSEVRLSPDRKVQIRSTASGSNWTSP